MQVPQEFYLFFVGRMDCGTARLRLPIGVREVLGQNQCRKHLVRVDDTIEFDVDKLSSLTGRPVPVRSWVRLTEDGAATDHAPWMSTHLEQVEAISRPNAVPAIADRPSVYDAASTGSGANEFRNVLPLPERWVPRSEDGGHLVSFSHVDDRSFSRLPSTPARGIQCQAVGYDEGMDIWERIRYARDRALQAEEVERQRLAEAETAELQQAASVRLATRQAVREVLDDVLDEQSEPARGAASGDAGGVEMVNPPEGEDGSDASDAPDVRWWAQRLLPTMRSGPMPVLERQAMTSKSIPDRRSPARVQARTLAGGRQSCAMCLKGHGSVRAQQTGGPKI